MGASNSRPDPVVLQELTEGGENARIRYGVSSIRRKNLKDSAFAAVPDLDNLTSFFGVYDGGEGVEVALLCSIQFHYELRNHPLYHRNLGGAMRTTFHRMDELLQLSDEWKKLLLPRPTGGLIQHLFRSVCMCAYHWPFTKPTPPYAPPQESGSTACVAAIRGHKIVIGNAGHSRCIISRNGQAIELTTVHKPDNRTEKRRIERAGGQVTKDRIELPGEAEGFLHQRGSGIARINGILTHSRAIGYFAFKSNKTLPYQDQMVTCDPEIITMGITNDVEFLAIVSEGIWTYLTSQGVVDFIRPQLAARKHNLSKICKRLCEHCKIDAYTVTAILVQFKDAPPPEPEENLSGGSNNNNDHAPAAAVEGSEKQPLLAGHEITEE